MPYLSHLMPHFLKVIINRCHYRAFITLAFLLAPVGLTGCSGYDVKVNDRVVYTPAGPFSNFQMEDENLQGCVQQHIKDNNITAADQLQRLNCSHAGIRSVQGLAIFRGLVYLRLSHNLIADVTPLAQLGSLEELQLDHNPIENAAPLAVLVNLRSLDLSSNPGLACDSTSTLVSVPEYQAPDHC